MLTYDAAMARLTKNGQAHVLEHWVQLDADERHALLAQVESIDFENLATMRRLLQSDADVETDAAIKPAPVVELGALAERDKAERLSVVGRDALSRGSVGVVLVAGGQGSRLGYDGPKGAYRVGPVAGASLFEIHARKILALERRYGAKIPFYIMTSQVNDASTRAFFAEHANFGLADDRVLFFTQGMWPALSEDGKLILDSPSHIFMSPDGHGGTITALRQTGMFDDMDRRGVETLFYFQVDNPLVDIADPTFIGVHLKDGADVSTKVCAKREPEEGLGVVAVKGGRQMVVEYSELTPKQMHETLPDGNLKLRFGSVAIHVFAVAFLKQAAAALPLHMAHKKIPYLADNGSVVSPEMSNGYKFEKFIFDVIPDAAVALNVEFDRAKEFSPVKNATGKDSPATCQRDMMLKYAGWLETAGIVVPCDAEGEPRHKIEIDPCFALGPDELARKLGDGFTFDSDLLLSEEKE